MFETRPGETVVITADTESDMRVVNSTARAAFAVGAKPLVALVAAPQGVGKAADPYLPVNAIAGALNGADVWVEFNNQWMLYSTPYEKAMASNPRLRYMCLVGMNADMMIRTIGRVDRSRLSLFLRRVAGLTRQARHMCIETPAGTAVEFDNSPMHPMTCDIGEAGQPGVHMLSGQIGWSPVLDTIEGSIVFDGSLTPPAGLLKEPVRLTVRHGRVIDIAGGPGAITFVKWLEGLNDPNMFRLAHVCYGFNPGARLTGNVLEDERVWGCTEWGMGYQSAADVPPDGIPAVSHCDGICLNSSVWLDDAQLLDRGRVVDPEAKELTSGLTGR
ncbi:MAG: aminopeptidase [Firmicutes bacterium]|nr:aminopeptidase [Bacillota bacterium]